MNKIVSIHIFSNHLRSVFCNHYGCGQMVTIDHLRHNTGVHHSQGPDISDPKPFVDHSVAVISGSATSGSNFELKFNF